ncbi:MAG TPA: hypothetical protein VF599_17345 [Pyrinomonadaceae bacterium]|jgi:hypothetical protein
MSGDELNKAGLESLWRSQSKLRRNLPAVQWLSTVKGLTQETIDKFYLGLGEPVKLKNGRLCLDALSVPVIGRDGAPKRRRIYYCIPKITVDPKDKNGWTHGEPVAYYSETVSGKKRIFVCDDAADVWRLDQETRETPGFADFLIVSSTHRGIPGGELFDPEFWTPFEEIFFGQRKDENGDRASENLRKFCFAEIKRALLPEGLESWADFFNAGGSPEQFAAILRSAQSMSSSDGPEQEDASGEALLGEFAIEPVNCNGGFTGGRLYYPYRVEKREIERTKHRNGTISESVVTSLLTKVVRSDGAVLDIGHLQAPRGTPVAERVLALSDGTRIDHTPRPNLYATWHLDSITEFIRRRRAGEKVLHRTFHEILGDLETHFRRAVWLPFDEDYAVVTLYAALSFVYNVFDAIPLLNVSGDKGTGKTELGLAFEAVSFNARVIGQSSAASAVRIINESRGLIIWDDLEAVAARAGKDVFGDLHQMLKLSYKKKTSKKAVTARSGQSVTYDFYGPKVINNTRGVEGILGSRMLTVRTARLPLERRGQFNSGISDPDFTFALRNELHVWGMITAAEIDRVHRQIMRENRGERRDEILAPLKAIASLPSNSADWLEHLETACRRENEAENEVMEPIEALRQTLQKCVDEGFTYEVSLPHVQLQIALLLSLNPRRTISIENPFWKQPQWIGNAIEAFREKNIPVRRARLYGKETRIYRLSGQYLSRVSEPLSPEERASLVKKKKNSFDFCVTQRCVDCPFVNICEETVPGLMSAKKKRFQSYE